MLRILKLRFLVNAIHLLQRFSQKHICNRREFPPLLMAESQHLLTPLLRHLSKSRGKVNAHGILVNEYLVVHNHITGAKSLVILSHKRAKNDVFIFSRDMSLSNTDEATSSSNIFLKRKAVSLS